jgi:hypothetical protein
MAATAAGRQNASSATMVLAVIRAPGRQPDMDKAPVGVQGAADGGQDAKTR